MSGVASPTPLEAWDEVFVRCTRQQVNAVVVDPSSWAAWWPGMVVEPLDDRRFDLTISALAPIPARHRLVVTVDRVRPRDKGLEFSVSGDLEGTGEFFHLDGPRGVVVNHLLRGTTGRRLPRVWLAAHRAIVRAGLTSLKDRMEGGLPPGTEPDRALLAHQAEEMRIFAEEVARDLAEKAALAEASRAGGSGQAREGT